MNVSTCNANPQYPYRNCSDCDYNNPLQCYPCADIIPISQKINSWKPSPDGNPSSEGYWRIIVVDIESPSSASSNMTVMEDVAYESSAVLSLSSSSIVSDMISQACNLVITTSPAVSYTESQFPGYYYCGQIVAIYNDFTSSYCSAIQPDSSSSYYFYCSNTNGYNSLTSRATLFQIAGCGSYSYPLNSTSQFSLWNLQTEGYVYLSSLGGSDYVFALDPSTSSPPAIFQMTGAPFRKWETFNLTLVGSYQTPSGSNAAPPGSPATNCFACIGGPTEGPAVYGGVGPNPCSTSSSNCPNGEAKTESECNYCPGKSSSTSNTGIPNLSVYNNGYMTYTTSSFYTAPLWMTPVAYNQILYTNNLLPASQFPIPIPSSDVDGYVAGSQTPYYT